jgi:hypothetical protein
MGIDRRIAFGKLNDAHCSASHLGSDTGREGVRPRFAVVSPGHLALVAEIGHQIERKNPQVKSNDLSLQVIDKAAREQSKER